MKEPETIEEFKRAIDFLRLGIENELLRRQMGDMLNDHIQELEKTPIIKIQK